MFLTRGCKRVRRYGHFTLVIWERFHFQGGPGDSVQRGGERGNIPSLSWSWQSFAFALKLCFEKRTGPPLHPHNSSPYPSQHSRSRSELKATEHLLVSEFRFFSRRRQSFYFIQKLTGAPGFHFLMLADFRNPSDVLIAHSRTHPLVY